MPKLLSERQLDRLELTLNREPRMSVAPRGRCTEARYWLDVVMPYFAPGLLLRCPRAMFVLNDACVQSFICGFSNRLWIFSDGSHILATDTEQRIF